MYALVEIIVVHVGEVKPNGPHQTTPQKSGFRSVAQVVFTCLHCLKLRWPWPRPKASSKEHSQSTSNPRGRFARLKPVPGTHARERPQLDRERPSAAPKAFNRSRSRGVLVRTQKSQRLDPRDPKQDYAPGPRCQIFQVMFHLSKTETLRSRW